MIPTPPTLAGLFFCLASAEGAGLLFCHAVIQPNTSAYSGFLLSMQSYTTHVTKQRTDLYRGFSRNLYRSAAADTRPIQAAIIPSATRWSVSQRRSTSNAYPQIPAPRRTLYRPAQPPYYNKVYKGAPLLWIHARRCSISQTMPARRLAIWHPPPGGAVQQQEGGGRSGTIDVYRRISFRAFAR